MGSAGLILTASRNKRQNSDRPQNNLLCSVDETDVIDIHSLVFVFVIFRYVFKQVPLKIK